MKLAASCRLLGFLFSCFLAVASLADQKPEKLWKHMGPINNKYDWLRPPDSILEAAVTGTYSGAISSENFVYKYKKQIDVTSLNRIWEIWLSTPIASAVVATADCREKFADKPTLTEVNAFRNFLTITVMVQTFSRDDFPNIGLVVGDRITRPTKELPLGIKRITCGDYAGLSCWSNGKMFKFFFSEPQRLSGPGYVVLRWGDFEKRIPINLDYLW